MIKKKINDRVAVSNGIFSNAKENILKICKGLKILVVKLNEVIDEVNELNRRLDKIEKEKDSNE